MAVLLGIDLGTSGVKVLAIDKKGRTLATAMESYPLIQPKPGWSEQNPDDWWAGVKKAIQKILSDPALSNTAVEALALSGQMHGSVFLDDQNEVIRRPLLWNDTRTFPQCRAINEKIGEDNLLQFAGNPALEGFTLPKLLWLRDQEPAHYERLHTLFLPKDYIVFRLTEKLCTEVSDAAGTLLFDVKNRCWSKEICEALEVDTAILPEVLESVDVVGHLSHEASRETGLPINVKVIAGGADNACSAVGNGIVREGIVLASIGSSGVVLAHANEMRHDPQGRIHSFNHSIPHNWYLMGVMLSAGLSMSWLKNDLLETDYETINREASEVPAGSEGVLFLPYLSGERTPHRDPKARGVFFGLSGIHRPRHLMRSVFEGVSFGLKDSLELIKSLGVETEQIRVTGGGAKSELWRKILADVFSADVYRVQSDEGPAFGAALLAGVGAGIFRSVEEATDSTVHVGDVTRFNKENSERYASIYPLFQSLYHTLKPEYDRAFQLYDTF
jgi:xylulokinase